MPTWIVTGIQRGQRTTISIIAASSQAASAEAARRGITVQAVDPQPDENDLSNDRVFREAVLSELRIIRACLFLIVAIIIALAIRSWMRL